MSLPLATEIEEGMEIVSPPKAAVNLGKLGFGPVGIVPLKTFKPKVPVPGQVQGPKSAKIDLNSDTAFPALNTSVPPPSLPLTPATAGLGAAATANGPSAVASPSRVSPSRTSNGATPSTPAMIKKKTVLCVCG